jgi:membrane fusion protein (multidrug efflux system)
MDGDAGHKPAAEAPDKHRSAPRDEAQNEPQNESQEDAQESPQDAARRRRRRRIAIIGALIVAAVLATAGVLYWLHARHYESTDDAFIDGHITQMAPQVSGRVVALLVDDNQHVTAGQPLLRIDPRDFQVKLDQARARRGNAEAQLRQAEAQVGLQRASVDQARANVRVTEAELVQAQQDSSRYHAIDQRAITRQQLDNATATVRSAQARLDANRQAVEAAEAQVKSAEAQVQAAQASLVEAEANVADAELQLSYTNIVAPAAGRITRRTVELGNYVNPGQAMLAIVQDSMWVTANFKETQLADMKQGQEVGLAIDAFPGKTYRGRVDSFQTGSGSAFSSLPAENATGNYVKVVQRVPVKIVFDDDRVRDLRIAPGLSVVPSVTVR